MKFWAIDWRRSGRIVLLTTLLLLLIVPRIFLYNLGPDVRRISDTHLAPWAFSFLQAASDGRVSEYLLADNKYAPLGGMLIAAPLVLYYGFNHIRGTFESTDDFLQAYALRETTEYFWIQAFMLLVNAAAILLTLYLARTYARRDKSRAVIYALALMATSTYALVFATAPRIHSLTFLMSAIVLWASFRLVRDKSWTNCALAFGSAGLTLAIAQTGITAFALPLIAYLSSEDSFGFGRINWRAVFRIPTIAWGLLGLGLGIVLGYPRILLGFLFPGFASGFYGTVVSTHHPPLAIFGSNWLPRALQHSFGLGELAMVGALLVFLAYMWWWMRDAQIYEKIAALHVAFYTLFLFPLWGADIGGYYVLNVLPSLIFLGSHVLEYAERKKLVYTALIVLIALQAAHVVVLTRNFMQGETLNRAHVAILKHTKPNDNIIGTFDPNVLTIAPTPEVLERAAYKLGRTQQVILERDIRGVHSRNYDMASTTTIIEALDAEPEKYQWVVLQDAAAEHDAALCRSGYSPFKRFIAYPLDMSEPSEITSVPSLYSLAELTRLAGIGPNITLYAQTGCREQSPL